MLNVHYCIHTYASRTLFSTTPPLVILYTFSHVIIRILIHVHRGIAPGIAPAIPVVVRLCNLGLPGGPFGLSRSLCSPRHRMPSSRLFLLRLRESDALGFLTPALISASRIFWPSASMRSSKVAFSAIGVGMNDVEPGAVPFPSMTAISSSSSPSLSPAAASASSVAPPPRVLCFRGQSEGSTICWKRGSTARSSNHAWTRDSMSWAILGTSCNRDREPTRDRTERSSR